MAFEEMDEAEGVIYSKFAKQTCFLTLLVF